MVLKFVEIAGLIVITLLLGACSSRPSGEFTAVTVFQSEGLVITQIADNTFIHTSYLQTQDFGNVPCNGLIVRADHEVVVFDTPTSDSVSVSLLQWIEASLQCTIKGIVPTHFHSDCLGGLQAFHDRSIPSYAFYRTIELATEKQFTVTQNGFQDSLVLPVGKEKVIAQFFGEGHTADNIVGYFPGDHVLFGGCLIKETGAGIGYLGDSNIASWSGTVEKIREAYPQLKYVVPGHGKHGDTELLEYTISLFKE